MSNVTYDFSGRHVVVTGASRGIGLAVAQDFVASGASLTILADDKDIHDAARQLEGTSGRTVSAVQCDITDVTQVTTAIEDMETIDVLVNNAGLERETWISDLGPNTEDQFRRIVDINVVGTYLVTRAAIPRMTNNGRIIITASIWARTAVAGFSAYCATKHANLGFMRSMAHELAPNGINVNAVCPGWVKTDASLKTLVAMAKRQGRSEDEILKEISEGQIISGLMEPDDVAPLYLFLSSDGARNVTGQAWHVDRGEVMA